MFLFTMTDVPLYDVVVLPRFKYFKIKFPAFISDIRFKVVLWTTSSHRSTAIPFASRATAAPPRSWSTRTLHTGEIHFRNWKMIWTTRTVWIPLCLRPPGNCRHETIDVQPLHHRQVRQRRTPTPSSTNSVSAIIIIIPVKRQSVPDDYLKHDFSMNNQSFLIYYILPATKNTPWFIILFKSCVETYNANSHENDLKIKIFFMQFATHTNRVKARVQFLTVITDLVTFVRNQWKNCQKWCIHIVCISNVMKKKHFDEEKKKLLYFLF